MNIPLSRTLAVVSLAVLVAGARARAQVASSFEVHWNISAHPSYQPTYPANAGIVQDVITFYEHLFGTFPSAGPHVIERWPGGREAFYTVHLNRVRADVARAIPDINWNGYAVIDYETWSPYWTLHENTPSSLAWDARDRDFIDDWKDYIREFRSDLLEGLSPTEQEGVFRDTWLAATREFYIRTLEAAREIRPQAKWGYYGLPENRYFVFVSDYAQYPVLREQLPATNDFELGWMRDHVDALYPSFYTFYHSVPNPRRGYPEDRPEDNTLWWQRGMAEFRRFAPDKPILPFTWYRRHGGEATQGGGAEFLNQFNTENNLRRPHEFGAAGVILWGRIDSVTERDAVQAYLNSTYFPIWEAFRNELNASPPPPPGGGGTGGSEPPPTNGSGGGSPGGSTDGSGGSSGGTGGNTGGETPGGGSAGGGSSGGSGGGTGHIPPQPPPPPPPPDTGSGGVQTIGGGGSGGGSPGTGESPSGSGSGGTGGSGGVQTVGGGGSGGGSSGTGESPSGSGSGGTPTGGGGNSAPTGGGTSGGSSPTTGGGSGVITTSGGGGGTTTTTGGTESSSGGSSIASFTGGSGAGGSTGSSGGGAGGGGGGSASGGSSFGSSGSSVFASTGGGGGASIASGVSTVTSGASPAGSTVATATSEAGAGGSGAVGGGGGGGGGSVQTITGLGGSAPGLLVVPQPGALAGAVRISLPTVRPDELRAALHRLRSSYASHGERLTPIDR
jgi:hypothetical protein